MQAAHTESETRRDLVLAERTAGFPQPHRGLAYSVTPFTGRTGSEQDTAARGCAMKQPQMSGARVRGAIAKRAAGA